MYRVLIADDESIIREGIKCLFDWESLGYTIAGEAANGETAYQQILALQPDIVLLDIRMPGMSGLDVIREARAQGFTGKVIILSGYSDFKYAQEAIRYGVQYYLTKPIDEDELEEILRSIKENLDKAAATANTREHYREKARETIIRDLLTNDIDLSHINTTDLHLTADTYQVVIYEKYSHNTADASYRFSDLLRVTNQDNNSYDNITPVASGAAQLFDVGVGGAYPAERAVHDVGDAGLERHSAQQGAPYVAVGEGACQAPVGVGGKERHYAVVD